MGEQVVFSNALHKESFGKTCSAACKVAHHTPAMGMHPCSVSCLSQAAASQGGFSSVGELYMREL